MKCMVILAILGCAFARPEAPLPGGYNNRGSSGGFGFSSGGGSSGSGLNEYVDQALLQRVAAVIASGGDGTATGQDNEGAQYVDDAIFTRVASSLGDSGSSSAASGGYGAPARSGGSSLGQPEPAQRIAEWDLSETSNGGSDAGGYSGPAPAPSGGYSAPSGGSRSFGGSSSGGAISLGNPEPAQRVAEFDASEQGGSRSSSGGFSQGGYN